MKNIWTSSSGSMLPTPVSRLLPLATPRSVALHCYDRHPLRFRGAMNTQSSAYRRGLAAVAGAFALWGLFPLYFRELAVVPPFQIAAHRVVWGCVVALLSL